MKWVLIVIGFIVCLVLIPLIIGYLLPVKHKASIVVTVNATPDIVWQRITDINNYPAWRKDINSVELVSPTEWIEINKDKQRLAMKRVIAEPIHRLMSQINDKNLPFGGTWEFVLQPRGNATDITITENGEVYNPFFRFVSKFIMGHTATLKKYGGYLQASFQ
jgi:hypothetical protein